jgi:[ribosomal protein S5]-alanine N-acetyltransferase
MATASQIETSVPSVCPATVAVPAGIDWRAGLPVLHGSAISLRELRLSDAPALLAAFGSAEVTRLISPPPPTLDGFEKFITWTHRQREAGQSLAFGITVRGSDTVVGLFQVRALQPSFDIAEWGFALGAEHWGSGMFMDGAELVLDFVFDVLGVHRLEARAALKNGRGNGALQKLGAVQEAVLRRSFLRNGVYLDQACWTILAGTWRELRAIRTARVIH